jgi:23S rRNA (uracil1939-C5)-methyltransferase
MKKKKKERLFVEGLAVIDAGSEGMAVAKHAEKIVFVPYAAPGDILDVEVYKNKRRFMEGRILRISKASEQRTPPSCRHFGTCGGCRWQHLDYTWQLHYKEKQVKDNLERLAGLVSIPLRPIVGSERQFFYRNKLEFTFSSRKWLTQPTPFDQLNQQDMNGLGFHLPGMFDRILDIDECLLQENPSNDIRLAVRNWALSEKMPFYDTRSHSGLMRNLIIRNTSAGRVMVILVTSETNPKIDQELFPLLTSSFPEIHSLVHVVNPKKNDTINDLDFSVVHGESYLSETMASPVPGKPDLNFRIGPLSFYQTNPKQAESLYRLAYELASFKGNELVYDLYTGTGTIACYIAHSVKEVVGIEYVESAVSDARINATDNQLSNVSFVAGDMASMLDDSFVMQYGKPDVVITDPPRSGMHPKVVEQLIKIAAEKIVYISCNPATQARDLMTLKEHYDIIVVQPVDMFPQTHHVENIVLLHRKLLIAE